MDASQDHFLDQLWSRFSSFNTLARVVAWIKRFLHNCKQKNSRNSSDIIASEEFLQAKNSLLRLLQQQSYPEVFSAIKSEKPLPKHHPLYKFIITSQDNILRIHSRVRDTSDINVSHLLIPLHAKSTLTKLLLKTLHTTHFHAGVSAIHSILVSTYFIPGLRALLKHISRSCASCQRAYARPLTQQMGLLPPSHTTPSSPFTKTEIDFAGPFYLRQGYTRKPVTVKCYMAVFVCLSTKAVHLDLCSSLSTVDFRATLSRFVARRGCPTDIFSDNGSNFVGAREEIREMRRLLGSKDMRQQIHHFASQNDISWHHIPPRAPHFGGLWEAAVKSMKLLLKKNLQPHLLRYDEFYTVLVETESILNS